MRNTELFTYERQGKLATPTFLVSDIAQRAMALFRDNYSWESPLRSIGVRGCELVTADKHIQLDLFEPDKMKFEDLEKTIDLLRHRFGHYRIQRCAMLLDRKLTGFNPKDDHVIHPVSYF